MSSYAVLWFLPSGPVLGRATDGAGNRAPCSMQRLFNGSAWRISPKSLLIWLHNLSLNQQCSKESLSCGPVNIPNIQEFHVISFFRSKDSSYSFMYYPVNYPYRKAKTNSQNLKHKSAVKYCFPESLTLSIIKIFPTLDMTSCFSLVYIYLFVFLKKMRTFRHTF